MNRVRPSIDQRKRLPHASWLLVLLLLASGCWNSSTEPDAADDLSKKPERPFEELRVFTEPNERASYDPAAKEDQRVTLLGKPGHWTGVLVQGRANAFDFDGRLITTAQDAQQRPVDLELSPFWLATTRGASLPKGQQKTFETLFFPPRPQPTATVKGSTWIAPRLEGRVGSGQVDHVPDLMQHLPSFQYFMLVLSPQAARYRWLLDAPTVRPPTVYAPANVLDTLNYRVVMPPVDQPLAVPSQMTAWTSTAYLIWDGTLPSVLSPERQQAILDWLHWGGGLVISGPDSLDLLKGSFLEPYLPATGGVSGPLDQAKLAELHTAWTLRGDHSQPLGSRAGAAWSGIDLVKHPEAEFLPNTAGLVAERRTGRGRIVVTAFRLTELDLVNWPSFDSFFNACLLDRLPREYEPDRPEVRFISRTAREGPEDDKIDRFDSELSTHVRILTRDERDPTHERFALATDRDSVDAWMAYGDADPIEQLKAESGTAGWNDFSWLSNAARATLQNAAGISVPRRAFVLRMVGLYLVVVVLLNWAVFRLLGRVEWAWVAVPLVAVFWGILVVWLAQLDIGFARAQTEIDVLELQPGYDRGHLTRYTALYTSLASNYNLDFAEPTAIALPFSAAHQRLSGETSSGVTLSTVGNRQLHGFQVASNSTGMVHSEQMLPLAQRLHCELAADGSVMVLNPTEVRWSGAVAIRRRKNDRGQMVDESAWLGTIDPGATASGKFAAHDKTAHAARRDRDEHTQPPENASGQLNLRMLLDRVEDHRVLEPDELRLVAWHDGRLGQLEVEPPTAQSRAATLVVAHLQFPRASFPLRDLNLRPIKNVPFQLPSSTTP